MSISLNRYLQELTRRLRLDQAARREIIQELRAHLEDLTHELQARGLSSEAAWREAVHNFGDPKEVASGLYAAHSRAPLSTACLAALPHILFALLFATHLWTLAGVSGVFLIFATVTTILAWRKGPPEWIYPWLGYCLVAPAAAWLLAFAQVGGATIQLVSRGSPGIPFLLYILASIYVLVALRLALRLLARVVRRDWLFASLMVFPFPVLTSWLVYLNRHGGVLAYDPQSMYEVDGATALVFLGLTMTTAVVYRVGQRFTKITILGVTMPLVAVLAGVAHLGSFWSTGVFLLLLFSILALVLPAYLESRMAGSDHTVG